MMQHLLSLLSLLLLAGATTAASSSSHDFFLNGIPQQSRRMADTCRIANSDDDGHFSIGAYNSANPDEPIGAVTASINDKSNKLVIQTFPYYLGNGHKITRTKVWVGSTLEELPRLDNGHADTEAFPYIHCNSTGVDTFVVPTEQVDCLTGNLVVVVYMELKTEDGSHIHGYAHGPDHEGSYFVIETDCDCGPTDKTGGGGCPTEPEVYLKSDLDQECHSIVAGSDLSAMKAGEVCVQVLGDVLDVVFQADPEWAMLRSQVWVGQEMMTGNYSEYSGGLDSMPKKQRNGAPDTRKFKNFECDWEGLDRIQFEIDLKYHCKNSEEYQVTVVAHSTVEKVDSQGNLIPGTELDVFAFEHTGDSDLWYGWFDFMIGCDCPSPPTRSFPAPPKETPSPTTLSPTASPTAEPTSHPTYAVTTVGSETNPPTFYPTATLSAPPTESPSDAPSEFPTITASEVPTETLSESPTLPLTESPTETPVCLMEGGDTGTICYPLWATTAWKADAGEVCISMSEYGTGNMDVTYTLTTDYWGIWNAHVWIGANTDDMPKNEEGLMDVPSFPYSTEEDGVSSTVVKSVVTGECDEEMGYMNMTLIAQSMVAEQCIPPNGTYIKGSDFDAYGVDAAISNIDSENDAYVDLTFMVDCNCVGPPITTKSAPPDTPKPTPTSSPSEAPSVTASENPTGGPTGPPSTSPSEKPTGGPTATPTLGPSEFPSGGPSETPTVTESGNPTGGPTVTPTSSPSSGPTPGPTASPTSSPSNRPTGGPTVTPTSSPSSGPTPGPSASPTSSPSNRPTGGPTVTPTSTPTGGPTDTPTASPTSSPSNRPTGGPTATPTSSPTGGPTATPTASPSKGPTAGPTASPTSSPSDRPTGGPTGTPTATPTSSPTGGPTATPTASPSNGPTAGPTATPTASPSSGPTAGPTATPTSSPSKGPTSGPTATPTSSPSSGPTATPTLTPTTGSVDTCIDTASFGDNGCFNLTAYGFTGIPPAVVWEGYFCVSMTTTEELIVTFDSVSARNMWYPKVWAGTDMADIPLLEDGTADVDSFPFGDESVVEQPTYQTTVNLDSGAHCSGSASYNLYIAGYALFADSCIPPSPTNDFIKFSDEPTWVQDVNNFQESVDQTYTYISIPITCDCVPDDSPDRRRLLEAPVLPSVVRSSWAGFEPPEEHCQEAFAFHGGRVSHGFQDLGINERESQSEFAWGWSNGPLKSSHFGYALDMVPHSHHVRGASLGKVKIEYRGNEAKLELAAGKNLWLKESHAYVGTSPLPHVANNVTESSVETIDPFAFPLTASSALAARDSTHSLVAKDLTQSPVYVIAHATICGDFLQEEESRSGMERSSRLRRRS